MLQRTGFAGLLGAVVFFGFGCAPDREAERELESEADALVTTPLLTGPAAPLPVCAGETTTYASYKDLAYGADPAHRLDVFVPSGAGPFPLVVFVHGGGWVGGDKASPPILRLATEGYVVASINYRFSDVAKFPAQIHDVKAALRWLRGNAETYRIAPARVGIMGGSAGAHLAALAGTSGQVEDLEDLSMGYRGRSSRVQAVVDMAGPTDFAQMDALVSPRCADPKDHEVATSGVSKLVGCVISTCPDAVQRANPIRYVTADDPPFLFLHGDADCTVPLSQSELLASALRDVEVPAELEVLPGAPHMGPAFRTAANNRLVDRFLDAQLKRCRRP